jgi:flagellar motility protein MotE (MotC chaperone)
MRMLERSKSAKCRVLVAGLLLLKLTLLLLAHPPALERSAPQTPPAADPALPPTPAQESAPASQPPTPTAGVPAASPSGELPASPFAWEPLKQLAASLERQRLALAHREAQLHREQEQLEMLKTSLREQLEALSAMHARIDAALHQKAEREDEELQRLARLYEATSPQQSSALLAKLDARLAARILMRMNGVKAGKVLSAMEPAQAARVSEQLAKKEEHGYGHK